MKIPTLTAYISNLLIHLSHCIVTHSKKIFYTLIIYPLPIGIMVRELANGPGDRSSIPGRVIPKDSKNGS